MNAPLRPDATPRLEDFPYRLSDNVRFADLDPNQLRVALGLRPDQLLTSDAEETAACGDR